MKTLFIGLVFTFLLAACGRTPAPQAVTPKVHMPVPVVLPVVEGEAR